ncbi:MAG: HAMP domain-containing sensor histidine kinase [Gemmatimonadaceae bacterium]|nr:HAMP domain-containing sensor histidine kinase [Gemmatimonadaceae bacterium]
MPTPLSARAGRATASRPRSKGAAADAPHASLAASLEAAARGVAEAWVDTSSDLMSREQVRDSATAIAEQVLAAFSGTAVSVVGLSPGVSAYRLTSRLRRAWVQQQVAAGDAAHDGQDALRVMRAFDAVDQAIEDDAAQRFAFRLSGADSAKLVVELAHDMRSAMGSILFLAETIRGGSSGPVTVTQQRQLGLIYSAALGLNSIVNDVMDLARGTARMLEPNPVPFQPSEVVSAVLAVVRPTAEEKELALETSVADIGTRMGHPAALNRVLLNLVTNALKFTEVGTVHIAVERGPGTAVIVRVTDTGRGMPPETVKTLFEAFRARAGSGGEYFSEAGLGLAMCQTLLNKMGSQLEVESREARGTTFSFSLSLPYAKLL